MCSEKIFYLLDLDKNIYSWYELFARQISHEAADDCTSMTT